MLTPTQETGMAPVYLTIPEETLVADDRERSRPAHRVERRVFDQLGEDALGISAYRLHQCHRGRALN